MTGAILNSRSCADRMQRVSDHQQCRQHDWVHNLRQMVAQWCLVVRIQCPFAKIADEQRQWLCHKSLYPRHHLAVNDTHHWGMQCDTPEKEQNQSALNRAPYCAHRWMKENNQI